MNFLTPLWEPDMVLLDLHLPDTGGDEVLFALGADERTSHILVVVPSADATKMMREPLLAMGARVPDEADRREAAAGDVRPSATRSPSATDGLSWSPWRFHSRTSRTRSRRSTSRSRAWE
jgi:CheY-like chemotaxis protein